MSPKILTDRQDTFLSEEAQQADRLTLMIVRAEKKVVDRYRTTGGSELSFSKGGVVQLDGWAEDENGDPDIQEMPADLVFALRDSIGRIVDFWAQKPGEADHVQSQSQGDRSVSFRDADLPRSVYRPLRPFDLRQPIL